MPNNYNQTTNTWGQVANQQSYQELVPANLNADELIVKYDPIYNKLVQQISRTIYHKVQIAQQWRDIGTTLATTSYPGMLRELIMRQRKGRNFPMDNGERPKTLLNYDIIDDEIEVRYHSAQMRWMYGYTIFDEELRRFSGGNGATITELTEMKSINAMSARNIFMDNLRKATLNIAAQNAAVPVTTNIDISSPDLTEAQAKEWLAWVDKILFQMDKGTTLYNKMGQFMQTPKSRLQMIIEREDYMHVVRTAFPDMFHREYYENIFPQNMIFIDSMGNDKLLDGSGAEVTPVFNEVGMNTTSYVAGTNTTAPADPGLQAVIMDVGAIGFEDNLNEVLVGTKDIEKLATPVRMHYWTSAYYTDLLPMVALKYDGSVAATKVRSK